MNKKKKTKYLLEFISEELYSDAIKAQIEMFKPLMVGDDDYLGEEISYKFRKRLHSISKDTFKSASRERKYVVCLRDYLDKLHFYHLKRRNTVFEKFKEMCLNLEFEEEEFFIAKYCKEIDVKLMYKHFKTKNKNHIIFDFNDDFFNEMNNFALDNEAEEIDENYLEECRLMLCFNELAQDERLQVIEFAENLKKNSNSEKVEEKEASFIEEKSLVSLKNDESNDKVDKEEKQKKGSCQKIDKREKQDIIPDGQVSLLDEVINS